ncbi:YSIRK signal domain/LPXTG anchor domain surface protein, partial [Streptococcus agalactiae]|nr:YSIRK signal domain/LPXTG anchor domain surface protein [Streptococcus agalactiae]
GHTITIQKPDGSTEDVFIKDGKEGKDGKDGKTQTVAQTPIKAASGKTIGTTIIVKDGDGKEVSRSNVLNRKDGVSPKVTVTPGKDKDGQPGHTITIQKPDGSTEDVFIKDGKDGKD